MHWNKLLACVEFKAVLVISSLGPIQSNSPPAQISWASPFLPGCCFPFQSCKNPLKIRLILPEILKAVCQTSIKLSLEFRMHCFIAVDSDFVHCHPLLCSTLQKGVQPSCWPAAFCTTPSCSRDSIPGQQSQRRLSSSPMALNRGLRRTTVAPKKCGKISSSNTLAEVGSRTVASKTSLRTKVCWCSFLIFCWFLLYWLH